MIIRVTIPEGRFIPDYGGRKCGETFDLPDELAERYLTDHPGEFEKVEEATDVDATPDLRG